MTRNKHSRLKYAKLYAKQGWKVLPIYGFSAGQCSCHLGDKCKSAGKHPRLENGVHDASKDDQEVTSWFKKWRFANVANATGKESGLIVLDVDKYKGGIEMMTLLEAKLGKLPPTVRCESGGGGFHLYFQHPGFDVKRDVAGKTFGKGVDVLGENSYCVAPPSKHRSGKRYLFKEGFGLRTRKVCALPEAWLNVLRAANQPGLSEVKERERAASPRDAPIIKGERSDGLTGIAGTYRAQGFDFDRIYARLKVDNAARCSPPLAEREVEQIAKSVSNYPVSNSAEIDVADELCSQVLNEHFAGGKHLLYDSQFWHYTGTHWRPLPSEGLQQRTHQTLNRFSMKRHTTKAALMAQVVTLLKARQHLDDDPLSLAKEPLQVFNCANGEVHMALNGDIEFRPHSAASFLRHCSDIVYEATATCPQYDQAVSEIFSEGDSAAAMSRHWNELMGYLAFPSRKIPLILILLGSGSNGKTSLMQTLVKLVGNDRVSMSRVEDLEGNRFMTGSLLGKLVFCDDDVKAGAKLPDGSLKKISETKLLTAELKYGSTFQFLCRAVPILACNNALSLGDVSHGMMRRVMVIPFDHQFGNNTVDTTLFDRIWAAEMPGILNRAIAGLQGVRQRGIKWKRPKAVEVATARWVTQSNPLPAFIEERCETGPDLTCYQDGLYKAYRDWAQNGGYTLIQQASNFQKNLEHLGYPKGPRGSQGVKIAGLKLRTQPMTWSTKV